MTANNNRSRGEESGSGQWQRLNLTAEEVEVLLHMTMKRGASSDELVRDVWPELSPAAGLARLDQVAQAINAAASAATGKPGTVMGLGGTGSAFGFSTPELYVRLLTGEPYVEAR